ncbi:MAG: hypothetical protein WC107_03665 [Patescibacteria group bacterium]
MKIAVMACVEMIGKSGINFNHLADIPTGVTPLVSSICFQMHWSQATLHPPKDHGSKASVEGIVFPGDSIAICDDVGTSGGSLVKGIEIANAAQLNVMDEVFVLMDREQGAREALAAVGKSLNALYTLRRALTYYDDGGTMPHNKYVECMEFLDR